MLANLEVWKTVDFAFWAKDDDIMGNAGVTQVPTSKSKDYDSSEQD